MRLLHYGFVAARLLWVKPERGREQTGAGPAGLRGEA
jgi:hypothetical protein